MDREKQRPILSKWSKDDEKRWHDGKRNGHFICETAVSRSRRPIVCSFNFCCEWIGANMCDECWEWKRNSSHAVSLCQNRRDEVTLFSFVSVAVELLQHGNSFSERIDLTFLSHAHTHTPTHTLRAEGFVVRSECSDLVALQFTEICPSSYDRRIVLLPPTERPSTLKHLFNANESTFLFAWNDRHNEVFCFVFTNILDNEWCVLLTMLMLAMTKLMEFKIQLSHCGQQPRWRPMTDCIQWSLVISCCYTTSLSWNIQSNIHLIDTESRQRSIRCWWWLTTFKTIENGHFPTQSLRSSLRMCCVIDSLQFSLWFMIELFMAFVAIYHTQTLARLSIVSFHV